MGKGRSGKIKWGVFSLKLFLSLLVMAGFVDIIYRGYILFTHQISPVMGTILFLVEVGVWIWLVIVLRMPKYRYSKPGFWIVFGAVLGIILVCAFAGIQPLSTYKDNVIQKTSAFTKMASTKISLPNTPIAPIATTEVIKATLFPDYYLMVALKPTSLAKANYQYKVDLFEKGQLRATTSTEWNQPEINVKEVQWVYFPLTKNEAYAYSSFFKKPELYDIFSVNVHE